MSFDATLRDKPRSGYSQSKRQMDLSGLVALDSALESLQGDGILVTVAGVHGQPALLMRRADLRNIPGKLLLSARLPQALTRARRYFRRIGDRFDLAEREDFLSG